MSQRRATSRRAKRRVLSPVGPYWLLLGTMVYLGVAATGIGVARLSQETRALYFALEQNQRAQDELLAQYSRLLLERSTLASYQNVDDIAERELGMLFPEQVERIVP